MKKSKIHLVNACYLPKKFTGEEMQMLVAPKSGAAMKCHISVVFSNRKALLSRYPPDMSITESLTCIIGI